MFGYCVLVQRILFLPLKYANMVDLVNGLVVCLVCKYTLSLKESKN